MRQLGPHSAAGRSLPGGIVMFSKKKRSADLQLSLRRASQYVEAGGQPTKTAQPREEPKPTVDPRCLLTLILELPARLAISPARMKKTPRARIRDPRLYFDPAMTNAKTAEAPGETIGWIQLAGHPTNPDLELVVRCR